MKKRLVFVLMFVMMCGTTVYAKNDAYEEIKVKANGEEIHFEIEGQKYEGNTKYKADPEIIMHLPADFDADTDEKLYFRVKWKTKTAEEMDYADDYYIKPTIFYVALPEINGEEKTISLHLKFDKKEYTEDTMYSLWLVGGKDYEDNFLWGKVDTQLKDDLVIFDIPEVLTTTEVFLTMGKKVLQHNGEEKILHEPLIFNEEGRIMVAAKDVPMIMEGKSADEVLWNKVSRTVTVKTNGKIFSMTEGNNKWQNQGVELYTDIMPEIRDGVMYLPLRELVKVFDFDELIWDGETQTVRLFRSAY